MLKIHPPRPAPFLESRTVLAPSSAWDEFVGSGHDDDGDAAQAYALDRDRLERVLRLWHQHFGQHAGAHGAPPLCAEDARLAGVRPYPASARPDDVPVDVLLRLARLP